MADLKTWLSAFRLRTLPLSLSSILMGGFLGAFVGKFDGLVVALCIITTLFLQILSNLANDYGDSIHGADSDGRKGPQRAVQSGKITAKQMKSAIFVFVILALISGIALLAVAIRSWQIFFFFLGLGILAIVAAITYTMGKKPYGYAGLGDISVFLFFGWVAVLGTFFLQAQYFTWQLLLPASSCGFFAVAVLNVNNIRDIESDKLAGKKSIPVRLGRKWAVGYHYFLLLAGLLCALVFTTINASHLTQYIYCLIIPLLYINARAVSTKQVAAQLDPYLRQMAFTSLIFVLTFGLGLLLAGAI
jgi:1,4-dihydroxy-2-naphthoate polyprenyltransferase